MIQALRLSAASRIVAVDTVASKEALARQFGATHFVDATQADAVEEIKKIVPHGPKSMARALGPGGVTWAFDCVGHPAVLRNAIDALDWGGTAVAIGVPPARQRGERGHQQPRLCRPGTDRMPLRVLSSPP